MEGFFNITSGNGCESCECNKLGADGTTCDMRTGQCQCRKGMCVCLSHDILLQASPARNAIDARRIIMDSMRTAANVCVLYSIVTLHSFLNL